MKRNATLVEILTNSSLYSDYARACPEATGLTVTFRPVESWQLPLYSRRKGKHILRLDGEQEPDLCRVSPDAP